MNILDPATATEKREAAYEIKFVVSAEVAGIVLGWARENMSPDPHAEVDTASGDGYRVNSLYFDTGQLDVYQRNGSYAKSKYRIRRYGTEECLYLERKLKSGGLVSKRRTRIPDEELWRVAASELDPRWVGAWFRRRLEVRRLLPQCQIRYDRAARLGVSPDGPIRLTVDRNVRGFATRECGVLDDGAWVPLLPGRCILELKFRSAMPVLFKRLLEEVSLTPQPVSKYRLSIQAFGLDPSSRNGQPFGSNGHVFPEALSGNHQPARVEAPPSAREA